MTGTRGARGRTGKPTRLIDMKESWCANNLHVGCGQAGVQIGD